MFIGYIIIVLIIAITMICLFKWMIDQEEREKILFSDESPKEPTERKLSILLYIFSIVAGILWPLVVLAVLVAVLVIIVTGLDN